MARELVLSQNRVAIVDDEDFEFANQHKWCWQQSTSNDFGYAVRHVHANSSETVYLLHREITGAKKGQIVIFRDHNGLNCCRSNLIVGTRSQVSTNSKVHKSNKCGIRNVRKEGNRYRAIVGHLGKRYSKYFETADKASKWAIALRRKLHGVAFYDSSLDVRLKRQK